MIKTKKVALVTGAAKRVGRAIALALAKDGWDVAIHYGNSKDAAEQTVRDIEATGQKGIALQANLAEESEANKLIARCTEALGLPVCLVNNASLFQYDVASSFSYAALDRHMLTNVAAPLILSRDMYRQHAKARAEDADAPSGVIVNLLDQKLANLNPDFLSYTLSKSALHSATTLLAQSFAPVLRVVGVAPGITMVSGEQSEDGFMKAHAMTPLGKSSTPDDIAGAVVYLANSQAITGTTLYVDGGQHLLPTDRDVMFLTE
ncbi:SDR family oxidoreductase [Polynucleobacter sp. MWH-Spelu-300-X4]|jgi:NAD(P)-dependent dehydrogenase (short-subunit alcohol dehydrogenase family)|uniref:SDR family oxidoreductase n=1 Tax=Polynucleobacter sp. MWH-Spelu-300-X4 TaxID=2689109 RepID=UPI001BFD0147|nr:SDR family oxidoreductase [Polynucleobacter sp. MWH-Spelu-300-X4]QWD79709.1 SDR family oxidoreductase [Polynucleobacter sp. MWH-Spelu-300-X4]